MRARLTFDLTVILIFGCLQAFGASAQDADGDAPNRPEPPGRKSRITPLLEYSRQHERVSYSRSEELRRPLDADRALSLDDLALVLDLADFLMDKRQQAIPRAYAAEDLGVLGHGYAIPAILATIRDQTNPPRLRQRAVIALSRIADERVINHLIDMLEETTLPYADWREAEPIGFTAATQLTLMTGYRPPSGATDAAGWRKWWQQNRGREKVRW